MRRNNISSIHNVLCILNVHPPPLSPPHRINITISTRWTARTGIREIIIVVVARPAGFVTVSITTGTGSLRRDRAGVVSSGRTGTSVVRKGESNARWHCHRRITWLPISRSPGQSSLLFSRRPLTDALSDNAASPQTKRKKMFDITWVAKIENDFLPILFDYYMSYSKSGGLFPITSTVSNQYWILLRPFWIFMIIS